MGKSDEDGSSGPQCGSHHLHQLEMTQSTKFWSGTPLEDAFFSPLGAVPAAVTARGGKSNGTRIHGYQWLVVSFWGPRFLNPNVRLLLQPLVDKLNRSTPQQGNLVDRVQKSLGES